MSETTAHEALARFLHQIAAPRLPDLAYVWHTANESAGGAKSARGVPIDVLKEARMGVVSGVWDWLYLGENQAWIDKYPPKYFDGIAIELKSDKAYRTAMQGLSLAQLTWRSHYEDNNWYTAIYPACQWHDAARLFVQWVGGSVEDFDFGV